MSGVSSKQAAEQGADLGVSRGVGENSVFYRSTRLIFRALKNRYKDPILSKFAAPGAIFRKNTGQNGILGTFWKNLTTKSRFFWRALPFQN